MTTALSPPKPVPTESERIAAQGTALWRWLRYLGATADEVEDVLQDTYLRALENGVGRLDPGAMAAWLRTTSRRLWLDRRRRLGRRSERAFGEDVDARLAEEVFLEHAADDGGDAYRAALDACLGTLSAREREALRLRYVADASRTEIGAALGLGEAGVKQLLRRLRARLKQCIERRRQKG